MEAEKLTLTVVTPERAVVDRVSCETVTLPAYGGEIGILPGHTPLITLLGIGVVAWSVGKEKGTVAVKGGFAEIAGDAVRILADVAAGPEAIERAAATRQRDAADRARLSVVGDEQLDGVNADAAYAEACLAVAAGEKKGR